MMIPPIDHSGSFGSSILPQNSSHLCEKIKKVIFVSLAIIFFIGSVAAATYVIAAYLVCASITASVISAVIAGSIAGLISLVYMSHMQSGSRRDSSDSDFSNAINSNATAPDTPDNIGDLPENATQSSIEIPNPLDTPDSDSVCIIYAQDDKEEEEKKSHESHTPLSNEYSRTPPDPTDHTKLLAVNTQESYENTSKNIKIGTPVKRRSGSHPGFNFLRIKQTKYRTLSADNIPNLVEDSDKEIEPDSAPLQDDSPKKTVYWSGISLTGSSDTNENNELQYT